MTTTDLATLWARTIITDAAVTAFVTTHFERPLTVFLGFDETREFGAADCPYVAVQPLEESCGPETVQRVYSVALYLGLAAGKRAVIDEGLTVQPGVTLMGEFVSVVMTALEGLDTPPLTAEVRSWPPVSGYTETHIMATYNEDQALHVRNAWV